MVPMSVLNVDYHERVIPELFAQLTEMGTTKQSEDAFNHALESKGINTHIGITHSHTVVSFTCLKPDLAQALRLIHEQLVSPKLAASAVESLKDRIRANINHMKDNTAYRASLLFTEAMFPKEHILRKSDPYELAKLLEVITEQSVKAYHKSFDPMHHAKWVLVGDVETHEASSILADFGKSGACAPRKYEPLAANPLKAATKKVSIKDKQSVDIKLGHALSIDLHHPDYLPLLLAVDALGGSFSARLMRTVRDEDGLTYNVGSTLSGFHEHQQGYWEVYGSFSPKLLDQGIKAIQKQLKLWVSKGISQEELSERKQGMVGRYHVSLSNPATLASKLATNIENGFDIDHIYTLPEQINQVTLEQVNQAIKKYIDLDMLICAQAGNI